MAIVSQHSRQEVTSVLSDALHERSGALIGLGIVLTVIGIWALFANLAATVASMVLFGGLMLAAGVTQLVLTFFARRWTGVASHLVIGIFAMVTGAFLIRAPLMGASAITLLFAAWLLASGIGEIAHALLYRMENWGWSVASGIVAAFFGALLLAAWPAGSLWLVGVYAGIALIFQGTNWVALGVTVRRGSNSLKQSIV